MKIKLIKMKKAFIIFLFSILFYNCSNTKEEDFLENFKEVEKIDYSSNIGLKKQIINDDLYILTKSEAINEFEFDTDKKYYYGCKTKISDDCYLLTYTLGYRLLYNRPFSLDNGYRVYWCLYQKGIGLVSKIKMSSNDPILSDYKEKNGVYTIKSFISVLKSEDTPENKIYFVRDSIVTQYKIENNRFVKIK